MKVIEKIKDGIIYFKNEKSETEIMQDQIDELLIMNLEQSMMINDLAVISLGGDNGVVQ